MAGRSAQTHARRVDERLQRFRSARVGRHAALLRLKASSFDDRRQARDELSYAATRGEVLEMQMPFCAAATPASSVGILSSVDGPVSGVHTFWRRPPNA
jgi:hypothetical protein